MSADSLLKKTWSACYTHMAGTAMARVIRGDWFWLAGEDMERH